MKALLKSILKKMAYLFAGLIIFSAIIVCISRLLTPVLDAHRSDFEQYASSLLNMPVTIKEARVIWYQYQPGITFNQVTVLNKNAKQPILQVQKVRVFFSVPQSIWHWRPVPSGIMISGTQLTIHQTAGGDITVQGFHSLGGLHPEPYQNETKFTDVMGWLSAEERLTLQNIDIHYQGMAGQKRFITLSDLSFRNTNASHIILGGAILHQSIPTEVKLALQWEGKEANLAKIKARGYLYVSGLSLSQWFKDVTWQGFKINSGVVSAKIWGIWKNNGFRKIQTTMQGYDLNLYSANDKSIHRINRLSGNFGWKIAKDGQQTIAGDDILIDLPHHLWPVTNFTMSFLKDAQGKVSLKTVNLGYVDLADLESYLFSFPQWLPTDVINTLSRLHITGSLKDAAISFSNEWTDWHHFAGHAHVSNLSFTQWGNIPGLDHFSGALDWDGKQGDITIDSNLINITDDTVFANPIRIEQLTGHLQFQQASNQAWLFNAKNVQVLNSDLAANVNGSLTLPLNKPPVIDLNGHFALLKATNISHYLPLKIFDSALVEWLKSAFLSGEVQAGQVTLRGPLTQFPFDQTEGKFEIKGKVKNVTLNFAPHWPMLQHINGNLIFSGRKMLVDVDEAQMLNITIPHVHGEIPYMGSSKPQLLTIQSDLIQTDFANSLAFLHKSPLQSTIGKMFADVNMKGNMQLKLGLKIPLSQSDNTKVLGEMTFSDAEMQMVPWQLNINHLLGDVRFTEDSVTAKNIQAKLFDQPLRFYIETLKNEKQTKTIQVNFTNNLKITDLERWLHLPFSDVVTGATDVNGSIAFSSNAPMLIHLDSKLIGLAVHLPVEYGKAASIPRDFKADIIIDESKPLRIELLYDQLLGLALVLDKKNEKFNLLSANLHLGPGVPAWPNESGIYITGQLPELSWEKIQGYIGTNKEKSKYDDLSLQAFKNVDLLVANLDMFGQHFTDLHLQLTPDKNNVIINVDGPQLIGKIEAPTSLSPKGQLHARFQKIYLRTSGETKQTLPTLDARTLPAMTFSADDFRYNDLSFGRVSFQTSPKKDGLDINAFNINSPRMRLHALGDWLQSDTSMITRLQGNLDSSRVTDLLTSFGLDAHNLVAKEGNLIFTLRWTDSPFTPNLATLSGQGAIHLGPGRIIDIDAASGTKMDIGRMLSIFSLQTIPRRLNLDFSDVFQKGYSFDYVRGDFTFHNGNVFTTNTRFEGPVAQVNINGRIGLNIKDYDFTLSVTPHVISSLPIAATLLTGWNPLVGLAALGVNIVLGQSVSKATTYYYAVRGPWSNPSWRSIHAPRK